MSWKACACPFSFTETPIRALTRASRAFLQAPPADFGTHGSVLAPRGVVYLAAPDQGDLLEQTCAALHPHAPGLERLDHAALMARLPLLLRGEAVGAGLFEPGAADIEVHALHQGYLRSLRQHGGRLRCNSEVVALQRAAGVWTLALQDGATLQARHVVNAAGAWADRLGQLAGAAPIGLQPRRRSAFTFAAPPGVSRADLAAGGFGRHRGRGLICQARRRPAGGLARQRRRHAAA